MPEFQEHPHGTFCWAELMAADADSAKQFYSEVFGWSFRDDQTGPDMVYTTLCKGEKPVGALFQRNEEQQKQGVPPHWGSYVAVTDVDETARQATELGGRLIMKPADVGEVGRMAIIQDPSGAFLSLWQAKQLHGTQLKDEPGSMCWNELMTTNPEAAGQFLGQLFGWDLETQQMGDIPYTVFMIQGRPIAGMLPIQADWGEIPPNWMVYFAVDDCDQAVATAQARGAEIPVPPTEIANTGRFAMIQDPEGAVFGVIKLIPMD